LEDNIKINQNIVWGREQSKLLWTWCWNFVFYKRLELNWPAEILSFSQGIPLSGVINLGRSGYAYSLAVTRSVLKLRTWLLNYLLIKNEHFRNWLLITEIEKQ